MEIKIVVPTHKRAQTMTTHKVIDNAIFCVEDKEVAEYKEHHPNIEIISHPPMATLGDKRNWIIRKFKNVFMIDDDCTGMIRLHTIKGETYKIEPKVAYDLVQYTGNVAKLCGAYLFGYHHVYNPAGYDGLRPIKMKGYVMGASIGILDGGNLYATNEATACNDYYIAALNAYLNRKAFIDWRYCFVCPKTGKNQGGLGAKRSEDSERKDHEFLVRKFGDAFVLKGDKMGLGRNKMQYGKVLKLPF